MSIEFDAEIAIGLTDELKKAREARERYEQEHPRTLKLPVGLSSTQPYVVVGGPTQGRQWQIRRVQLDTPTITSSSTLQAAGSVTNPSANAAIASISPAPTGIFNLQATMAYGSTPGTIYGNFGIRASGVVIAAHLGPPLVAGASVTYTFNNVASTTGATLAIVTTSADSSGGAIYDGTLIATSAGVGGIMMYSDESLSQASLLWEFSTFPVSETFGRDEMTLVFPEVLVIDTVQSAGSLAGSIQVIDAPIGEHVR